MKSWQNNTGERHTAIILLPCDSSDEDARKMAADSVFLRDGLVMAVKLLFFLKKRRMTLAESAACSPEFETASRLIGIRGNSAAIMRQFHSETTGIGEGISISDERGRVLIRPVNGKGIMLYAESVRSETASELCDFYEHKIKDSEEKNGKENAIDAWSICGGILPLHMPIKEALTKCSFFIS